MITKQRGNREFWDRHNIEENLSSRCAYCNSNDITSDAFTEISQDLFKRFPMLDREGQDCPVYKERVTCENSLDT